MNKHRAVALLAVLLCCLVLVGGVLAEGSPNYDLSWRVVAGGGGTSESPHYLLNGTSGQGMAGMGTSAHYRLGGGFWYGLGIPVPPGRTLYLPTILKQ